MGEWVVRSFVYRSPLHGAQRGRHDETFFDSTLATTLVNMADKVEESLQNLGIPVNEGKIFDYLLGESVDTITTCTSQQLVRNGRVRTNWFDSVSI